MPVNTYWKLRGAKVLERMPTNGADRYRTCCNCWHIRTGTLLLGVIELTAVSVLLSGIIRQIIWKNAEKSLCRERRWWDCLIYNLVHPSLNFASYIGDYIIALLLIAIIICIILLFHGIITVKPRYLWPHLVIQAIGLMTSFGYFFLYAWSYFYGDLYIEKKSFQIEYFVERMWLSTIILTFSLFQCYLFLTVVKCSLYLNKMKIEQLRKKMQFDDVSNRVRIAKENGLWRSTSWGGAFQEYRGQYDKPKPSEHIKKQTTNRVQWNLDKNDVKSLTPVIEDPITKPNGSRNETTPTDAQISEPKAHEKPGKFPVTHTRSADPSNRKSEKPELRRGSRSVDTESPKHHRRLIGLGASAIIPIYCKDITRTASVRLGGRSSREAQDSPTGHFPSQQSQSSGSPVGRFPRQHSQSSGENSSPTMPRPYNPVSQTSSLYMVKKVSIASKLPSTNYRFRTTTYQH
ncbi:hypothetical protein DdX_13629 [Ditylenchus destructor]|uniref:Uncharacterized protein n=1 Tax=Ditylenchus destructor TaxID=166010 RepID=A0AAD4MW94_9BILA|nr:hypothetical protein DdX_13629 [Ditylenchus destructor]